jgi:predicted nucleic acid-binding protein
VRLVIADTGPVNYLILIGHIDLLPRMFERVVLPAAVHAELSTSLAPPAVQRWMADFPAWLEIAETPAAAVSTGIHKGEAAAIALAVAMHADLVLIDDRRGVRAAKQQGRFASPGRSACSILLPGAAWLTSRVQSARWKVQAFGDPRRSCGP